MPCARGRRRCSSCRGACSTSEPSTPASHPHPYPLARALPGQGYPYPYTLTRYAGVLVYGEPVADEEKEHRHWLTSPLFVRGLPPQLLTLPLPLPLTLTLPYPQP